MVLLGVTVAERPICWTQFIISFKKLFFRTRYLSSNLIRTFAIHGSSNRAGLSINNDVQKEVKSNEVDGGI